MPQDASKFQPTIEDSIQSESFAFKVLNASLNGIYVYDVKRGQNVFINKQYTALTGYTLEDLQSMDKMQFFALFHPDDRPRVAQHMEKILRSDEKWLEFEYRFKTRGGLWIWCLSRDSVFARDGSGAVTQFIGTFLDITDRKIAEQNLQNSEARYRELIQYANSVIIRWRCDGTITFFNEYAQALFGYSADEAVGRHVNFLIPQLDSTGADLRGLVQDILDQPQRYVNNINENICRDGRRVWMTWTNKAILDSNGRVSEILAVGIDITDSKQAELQLSHQRELLQSIYDNIPVLFVLWDPRLRQFQLNRHAEAVLGWTMADANEGDFMGKVYPDAAYRAEVSAYMQSLEPSWREWECTTKNGGRVPIDWTNIRLTDETLIGIGMDLRERKQAEKALRENLQELSEFSYVLTHNLKAPVRAIRNYVDFLLEDLGDTLEEEPKKYLTGLKDAVIQSNMQISDLEKLYRVRNHVEECESFEMRELLEEIEAMFKGAPDQILSIAPQWPVFRSKRFLLRQILIELIKNGFKFNRAAIKRVEVGWRRAADNRLELFVRDNGIGIDPAYHEQIGRIFQRLHTDREYKGTGIGLAIVKRAAQKLGGLERIESAVGEGSTFYVNLPDSILEKH